MGKVKYEYTNNLEKVLKGKKKESVDKARLMMYKII